MLCCPPPPGQILENSGKFLVYNRIPTLIFLISLDFFFSPVRFLTFSNTTKKHFKQFFGILNAYSETLIVNCCWPLIVDF